MAKNDLSKRFRFLAERYDIFECGEGNDFSNKEKEYVDEGFEFIEPVKSSNGDVLAVIATKYKDGKYAKVSVSIEFKVFGEMIIADPSDKKEFLQWMLNIVLRYLKNGSVDDAIRFIGEDLAQAREYLILFQENKRKKLFLEMVSLSYVLKGIQDRSDINQYKSLSQLFDAVDPFIERDSSTIERLMNKFVDAGKAEIPVRDRKYTVFIPKCRDANVIFDKFASWCTAKPNNGMFRDYTENNKNSFGKHSTIYIVIDNGFFKGTSDKMYQLHFETKQIRDRKQDGSIDFYEEVLKHSDGVTNFFKDELIRLARGCVSKLSNRYTKYLKEFNLMGDLLDLYDEDTPFLYFKGQNISDLSKFGRFKELKSLMIINSKMNKIDNTISELKNLEILSIKDNLVVELPKAIGYCSSLIHMNLKGNHIHTFPDTIGQLDKSRGGSLESIAVNPKEIGEVNFDKLKDLLPETVFTN